jgi:hypothetical protein
MPARSSKSDCLDGFSASIGCVERLGPSAFPTVDSFDVFEPSERVPPADADWTVDDRSDLSAALEAHEPGDVVWVDGVVDVTGLEGIHLEDVTLASGYGMPSETTGKLHTDGKPNPLFDVGDDVRITGLKLHGDEFEYFDPADRYPTVDKPIYEVGASAAAFVHGDDAELDCLELSGWTYAGVSVRRDGRDDVRTHVHHVDAVDNPAESLGYGVTVVEGCPLVEMSYFDNNRHSVAGSGWEHCGYVVRFNVVGDFHSSHAIDMHGEPHEDRSHPIAGRQAWIYNNVVKLRQSHVDGRPRPAVKFRGRPLEHAEVVGNWFFNERSAVDNDSNAVAVRQLHAPRNRFRNVDVEDNVYGTARDPSDMTVVEGTDTPTRTTPNETPAPERLSTSPASTDDDPGPDETDRGSFATLLLKLLGWA